MPERRRGQAFGLNSTGAMGGQGLAPAVIGALGGALGAGAAMTIAGAATILAALALRGPLRAASARPAAPAPSATHATGPL